MNVIIAGGREFNDISLMTKKMDELLSNVKESITIVSGTAKGADSLGEIYAGNKGYEVMRMPADWDTHGKSAGYKRNEAMARVADACVVFWDGKSKGSKHMIDIAKSMGISTRIVNY